VFDDMMMMMMTRRMIYDEANIIELEERERKFEFGGYEYARKGNVNGINYISFVQGKSSIAKLYVTRLER
jgi:hypothetical protein